LKRIAKVVVWAGAAMIIVMAKAVVPGTPRVIAGVDHATPAQIGEVLSQFCNANGCMSKLVWQKDGANRWNIDLNHTTPVSVESDCIGIHHQFCVETWGALGKAFMSSVQTQQLKHLLEASGAKVVLMDCQLRLGGNDVCTNGKPPT
jgi:hypothetical protein